MVGINSSLFHIWISYSTISFYNHIYYLSAYGCQSNGMCIGSSVSLLQYADPGFCDYLIDCPRFWLLSTSYTASGNTTGTFDGKVHPNHQSYVKGSYQRPALIV